MKKLIIILLVVGLIIVGYSYDQFVWCKKILTNETTTHTIQKGEYLSEIALKHYGKADYWRELALVNRAPDCDAVFPGEEILIPSLDVIKKIRRTKWLSRVNGYLSGQEILSLIKEQPVQSTVVEPKQLPAATAGNAESKEPAKSSSLFMILAIVGLVLAASVAGFIFYRKKKEEEITIVDGINLLDEREDTEPDYKEYLQNKDTEPNYKEYLRKKRERNEEVVLN